MANTFVVGTHNIWFKLQNTPDKWTQDANKSSEAGITCYQEAEGEKARKWLQHYCVKNNRGLFHGKNSGNPISWDNKQFSAMGDEFAGVRQVHLGAQAMGVNAKLNPPRDIAFVGLKHRDTGKQILQINVHPVSEGTKLESNPDNHMSDQLNIWKDWAVGQYWLDVLAMTARAMSRPDPGVETLTPFWDIILLAGDFNATLANERRWYYPAVMLDSLYENDKREQGLDHIVRTRGSDCAPLKNWTQPANTDHPLVFQAFQIKSVIDFPRDI